MTAAVEERLVRRVLDALLREDFRGMLSRSTLLPGPAGDAASGSGSGDWLALDWGGLLLPVRQGEFLCDREVRHGALVRAGAELSGLEAVLAALRPQGDPEEEAGFDSFAEECREALAADTAAAAAPPPAGALAHEVLAARLGHPVYPTASARRGITVADLRRYAPEHGPEFELRWVALPRDRVSMPPTLPAWWPGCPGGGQVAFPVHPLTWGEHLAKALADTGLAVTAEPMPLPAVRVTPTLSMRTVAVLDDPGTHLKLPLPTATLGALNRRTLRPGDLADGAAAACLLEALAAREPAYAGRVLHTDDGAYGHAGHELLGFLTRRLPDLAGRQMLPVAAFAAPGPDRVPMFARLAATAGADPVELFAAYLEVLLGWHVTLWLRYGVALEAHQQNVALLVDPGRGVRGVGLLYKDDDGLRVDPERLGPEAAVFADRRIAAAAPSDLADVFTTITLHLCAAAPAFALAEAGVAPRAELLALVRDRLVAAAAAHPGAPDAGVLRKRVLDAERLPVKAMVTAGTLLPKARTGAADINKFYVRTGPNYLREPAP